MVTPVFSLGFQPVVMPRVLAGLARELLRQSSRTSAPINLGRYLAPGLAYGTRLRRSQVYGRSVRASDAPRPLMLPLWRTLSTELDLDTVNLPTSTAWEFSADSLPRPLTLPEFTYRPLRSARVEQTFMDLGLPPPTHTLQMAQTNPYRPEPNRRRKDDKGHSPGMWNQLLSVTNRFWHQPSEWQEAQLAFELNPGDPYAAYSMIAMNQAIDVAYGARAQWLKRHIYQQPGYSLPIGLDSIRSLIHGRIPSPFF